MQRSLQEVRPIKHHAKNKQSTNVGKMERFGSVAAGAALIAKGLTRKSIPSLIGAVGGVALVYRGITGHCKIYEAADIDTSKPQSPNGQISGQTEEPGHSYLHLTQSVNLPVDEVVSRLKEAGERSLDAFRGFQIVRDPDKKIVHWQARKDFLGKLLCGSVSFYHDQQTPRRWTWNHTPGSRIETDGRFEVLSGPEGGARFLLELDYRMPFGFIGRYALAAAKRPISIWVKEELRYLKQLVETGEIARSDEDVRGGKNAAKRSAV